MKSAASMTAAGSAATVAAPGWGGADGVAGRPSPGQSIGSVPSRSRGKRSMVEPTVHGGVIARFSPGQCVFSPGSGAGMIYIVRAGCVRLYKTLPDRRTIDLGLLGPNTVFTQEDAHDGLASGTTAEALLDSTLLIVAEDNLQAVIAQSPQLAAPMVRGMTRRLTEVQTLVEHLAARDVSVRLAATLRALARVAGEPVDDGWTKIVVPVSRQALADMIGANRVTVTRKLIGLERAGAVRTLGRTTIAVNRDALQRFAAPHACGMDG